jgi:hypothetical protein
MKKIAILQSNYIPWKGYFDIINSVDEFILYDDVQYTRSDWRNRNKIKTPDGLKWLTIPIGKHYNKINETTISKPDWGKSHWSTIKQNYSKAKYFKEFKEYYEKFYLNTEDLHISIVNYQLIKLTCEILDINTKISWSSDYNLIEGKVERLIDLVKQSGGNEYISGAAAKSYIDEQLFAEANIKITWMDYSGYPEYEQLNPPFEHGVTILDLIFNTGGEARKYMKTDK